MMNWVMARTGVLAWLLGQTAYVEVALARRFSRVGANLARVDFFDLRPLAPFARRGLRSVTGFIAFTVLTSLLLLVPWAQGAAVVILVAIFGAALAALLAPVLGVHRRLVEAKQAELERVRAAIRAETHAADEVDSVLDRTRAFADATLSDLIAYEARIASASTWPFDPGTLFRFGLFVALGVGSWLGSALVERALGSALD